MNVIYLILPYQQSNKGEVRKKTVVKRYITHTMYNGGKRLVNEIVCIHKTASWHNITRVVMVNMSKDNSPTRTKNGSLRSPSHHRENCRWPKTTLEWIETNTNLLVKSLFYPAPIVLSSSKKKILNISWWKINHLLYFLLCRNFFMNKEKKIKCQSIIIWIALWRKL